MSIEEIIKASENYYFIVADGKIYTSEGYASDIHLGEEVFDLTISERPKGKWIMHIDDLFPEDSMMECNVCHEYQYLTCDENFCPNCGADMKGEK